MYQGPGRADFGLVAAAEVGFTDQQRPQALGWNEQSLDIAFRRDAWAEIGVDADFTTRVKAFIVTRGDEGDDALAQELQAWCKQRLRRYEYPHYVDFVTELPKTPTGKIQRYKLRETA